MSERKWLDPVPFGQVEIEDAFWSPRLEVLSRITIPAIHDQLARTGRIDAFSLRWKKGDPDPPHVFWDSDVAKWVEAACYDLAGSDLSAPDVRRRMRRLDEVVGKILSAQQKDGYLNTHFSVVEPGARWTNLRDLHELYCAGHLIEAAIAHFQAFEEHSFLEGACRLADCVADRFGRGKGKLRGYPGHQEIELALIRLYRSTGRKRYLKLAAYFIEERGRRPAYFDKEARARGEDPGDYRFGGLEYLQAHRPVREQEEAVGHAVRALYMYSAMADLARETGDLSLMKALDRLWASVCDRKMYITGGVGTSSANEGFTQVYDLPEESAYAETCAAVALVLFSHRMLQFHRHRRYADAMERVLYNGALSGLSLSGDRFFYSNPLFRHAAGRDERLERSTWDGITYTRQRWFGCACCPANLARLLASLGGYFYSTGPRSLWIHLFAAGSMRTRVRGAAVRMRLSTRYPWQGRVNVKLLTEKPLSFDLNLRIPGWCRSWRIEINGRRARAAKISRNGYVRIPRTWKAGDEVRLSMDMPVVGMRSHPRVVGTRGKTALQRGPLVYCFEEKDNPGIPLDRIIVKAGTRFRSRFDRTRLGGVQVIEGNGTWEEDDPDGSRLYSAVPAKLRKAGLMAVPYYSWDNRGPGAMRIWLRSERG
jgi:DUF1680 family protein